MAATEVACREPEDWACVVVFEFLAGEKETDELYRGSEANCLRLAARLERAGAGGRGIRYEGQRRDPLLHALTVVCPVASLNAGPE